MSQPGICCKICETSVSPKYFEKHSKICKEAAEIKEVLSLTKSKLVSMIEKAFTLKSTLNTKVQIKK